VAEADLPGSEAGAEKPAARGKLTLDAAIPGRAWLLGADGETSTVTEGDEIPGYGRVTKIDPAGGMVTTSSGRVIKAVDS
jgi:intracellular multiplication protein IcmG